MLIVNQLYSNKKCEKEFLKQKERLYTKRNITQPYARIMPRSNGCNHLVETDILNEVSQRKTTIITHAASIK